MQNATPQAHFVHVLTACVLCMCISQDPNARNCHGFIKFVKDSILEDLYYIGHSLIHVQ